VHDEARGEGVGYSARAASPPCPLARRMPTARTDGASVGTGSVGGGGGSAPPSPPLHIARGSHCIPRLASACPCARGGCCGLRVSAVRRGGTRRCPGRPRRRRAAAAPRRMKNGQCMRHSAAACSCTADGGGGSAGALNGRFAASANGAPAAVLGVDVGAGCDERSDDSAIVVFRRIVQRGTAIAVHGGAGVRGWAPRAKLEKVAETASVAKDAARNRETRQDGRGAYDSRNVTS
jgi:hypothetical protein